MCGAPKAEVSKALRLLKAAAGNLAVLPLKAADDGTHLVTFNAATAGFVVPLRVRRVMTAGTTATVAQIFD